MPRFLLSTEGALLFLLATICLALAATTESFLTLQNLFDLLNAQAVNVIFAVGLVVVLISGGIDISFSVLASVVQYVAVSFMLALEMDNWAAGLLCAAVVGFALGMINAILIHRFRIVSIVVTIGTFSLFFGLLMYITRGRSIYSIPEFLYSRTPILSIGSGPDAATLFFPVVVMVTMIGLTAYILWQTGFGRTVYGFGSNPEAARRSGVRIWLVQSFAYGWLGICAGIAGLMQVNSVREVVPNALFGRELDILAAVVLGGAVLGGGRGTVFGAVLGVLLLAVVQNGLNLLGVTPFAFQAIVGLIILLAITTTNARRLFPKKKMRSGVVGI